MVSTLRHKRSPAKVLNMPFPTSSERPESGAAAEDVEGPSDTAGSESKARTSGGSMAPSDGYSALFASGFLRQPYRDSNGDHSPTLSAFPSPPKSLRGPFHPSPEKPSRRPSVAHDDIFAVRVDDYSPEKRSFNAYTYTSPTKPSANTSFLSPTKSKSSGRRRRSSIVHTTPSSVSPRKVKSGGTDGGVERALDNVMRSLKVIAMGTPKKHSPHEDLEASRWSSSSDGSLAVSSEEGGGEKRGLWKPRKSGESTKSRTTLRSVKSNGTLKSKKSFLRLGGGARRSDETDRMDLDQEDEVPPVPVVMPVVTPKKGRRVLEGLAKHLGLTPKKKQSKAYLHGDQSDDHIPALACPSAGGMTLGEDDLPKPSLEKSVPRKSSFSSFRSALAKKTSTGTLRSVKSTKTPTHPFMASNLNLMDCGSPPPLPPHIHPAYQPRPQWKDGEHGEGCLPVTPRSTSASGRRTPKSSIGQPRLQPSTSPSKFLNDMPRRAPGTPKKDGEDTPDGFGLGQGTPAMPELRGGYPGNDSIDSIFDTPVSSLQTPQGGGGDSGDMYGGMDDEDAVEVISFSTPLTAKAAKQIGSSVLKPKRLIDLLPRQQRINLGLQTPESSSKPRTRSRKALGLQESPVTPNVDRHGVLVPGLRMKQSTEFGAIGTPARSKIGSNGLPEPAYSPVSHPSLPQWPGGRMSPVKNKALGIRMSPMKTRSPTKVHNGAKAVGRSIRGVDMDTRSPSKPGSTRSPGTRVPPPRQANSPQTGSTQRTPSPPHPLATDTAVAKRDPYSSPRPMDPAPSTRSSVVSHASSPSDTGTFGTFGNTAPLNISQTSRTMASSTFSRSRKKVPDFPVPATTDFSAPPDPDRSLGPYSCSTRRLSISSVDSVNSVGTITGLRPTPTATCIRDSDQYSGLERVFPTTTTGNLAGGTHGGCTGAGWKSRFEAGMGRHWKSRFGADPTITCQTPISNSTHQEASSRDQSTDATDVNEEFDVDMDTGGDDMTLDSHVPTEEWELEAYLKQLESVDGHGQGHGTGTSISTSTSVSRSNRSDRSLRSMRSGQESHERQEQGYHGISC